ncbi:NarK family nitrate/nitrite MFS transporter [Pontiella sp.]|uniref:NarK family nitrate/nitrite MFS transporter n=1 Tax=Pontiella sp. TaxID=2837462 RepID=UPI0035677BB0
MDSSTLNPLDLKNPAIRTLHLSWFAFFLTFVVWFSHAPLMAAIKETFDLTGQQVKSLLILNVALTIPARIAIGILVDKFGPRHVFSGLLVVSSLICFAFASAQSFEQLALFRFLLGFVGAGFVIGIRLVGEWFPAKQVGMAEGIYGGWGNFGSAAAAMTLPSLALLYGGENGWRYAVATTGAVALLYGIFFFLRARNTPKGSTYFKPKKAGGLEVGSKKDFYFYLAMNIPMYLALTVLTWKLCSAKVALLPPAAGYGLVAGFIALFFYQTHQIKKVNAHLFNDNEEASGVISYKFKQVAILDLAYFVTFGSELAVVSMLPLFFMDVFGLDAVKAGLLASGFAFMNLVARPGGGWLSDKLGRRKTLMVLICGLSAGYFVLGQVTSGWPVALAVVATMCCSFFVQAGEGAVFAMVPLVQRRMTGQIAGMVGAYGNVGAVIFLTVLSFVDYSTFFIVIGAGSLITLLSTWFLTEPAGHVQEVDESGNIQLIEVA